MCKTDIPFAAPGGMAIYGMPFLYAQITTYIPLYHIRNVMPEAVNTDRDKLLHPTIFVGRNYFPLSLMPASGTTLLIHYNELC